MARVRFTLLSVICLCFLITSQIKAETSPVTIKHMVVFGNAHSDTGNTRELFDELAGRKKPSRLREDIRFHGPDAIDAASSIFIASAAWLPLWYFGYDQWLNRIPVLSNYPAPTRLIAITTSAILLNQTGLSHWIARPLDVVIDRSQLMLRALLWLYPSIGLPVLPPGLLYNRGGRFTNGTRVWAEILAENFGLEPDKPDDFISLAYAGSHIRQRLSEDDMLSFGSMLANMDLGMGIASTLFSKGATSSEREGFWGLVADNMSKDGRDRFESLLKDGIPPSFEFMAEDYGNRKKYAGVRDPNTALYVISFGADDYVIDDSDPQEVMESLRGGIEQLIDRDGAKHILIAELQDPLQFPSTRNFLDSRKQQIREKVSSHNYILEEMVDDFLANNSDLTITLLSNTKNLSNLATTNNLSTEPCLRLAGHNEKSSSTHSIIKVPSLSKKTTLTDTIVEDASSLNAASQFIGRTVASCKKPEQHFFYDGFNLTGTAHKLIARSICEKLKPLGYVVNCDRREK